MSQQGDTLFYPSSANSPFNPPHHHHHHNNHQNQTAHNIQNNTIAVTMDSDEEKQHSSPSNGGGKTGGKSRRELPTGAVATLKAWLLSPEHFTHPYPTPQDQIMLMQQTGIDKKQLKNWFTNARRRIWKPMLKKQLEAGKLAAATGGGGGGVTGTTTNNISIVPQPELPQQQPPQQEMYNNYQQAAQMQQQQGGDDDNDQQYQQSEYQQYDQNGGQVQYDQYDNQVYNQQNYQQQQQQYQQQDGQQQQQQQGNDFPNCNSIGSLAPMNHAMSSIGSFGRMFKTDSHAVLMELFARDQDLVRQAAGKGGVAVSNNNSNNNGATNAAAASGSSGGGLQASGPSGSNLRSPTTSNMGQRQHSVTFGGMGVNNNNNNSSLSSWPHFSSVSSLNNLGGLQGVKSITNLSAADLSSMGNLNKMGNLAHVKSIEGNMGRGDSFAFLEVFFDDKSGLASSTHSSNSQRGVKREREDDDAIGLSLDGDDGTSPGQFNNNNGKPPAAAADQEAPPPAPVESGVPKPAPLPEDGTDNNFDDSENGGGGTLKRAYDDALAARGLIAVRRSCEKLTDLDLPNKMQRTLSQEYIRQHNQGQPMGDFFSSNNSAYAPNNNANRQQQQLMQPVSGGTDGGGMPSGTSVEVPSSTKCTLCTQVNVDTQLRPCGHMFHGRCLKPSLTGMSPPKCPICNVPMQSAILAVPSVATTADVDGLSSNLQVNVINKQD